MPKLAYPAAETLFKQLVHIMDEDNGCTFTPTPSQLQAGTLAVQRMAQAGYEWPATNAELAKAADDVDSDMWNMAAGEVSDAQDRFSRFDGWTELHDTLNEVFGGAHGMESPVELVRRLTIAHLSSEQSDLVRITTRIGHIGPIKASTPYTPEGESLNDLRDQQAARVERAQAALAWVDAKRAAQTGPQSQ